MFHRPDKETPKYSPFAELMRRLGESFTVADVLSQIVSVTPDEEARAKTLAEDNGYSVVPISDDGGNTYDEVYCTGCSVTGSRKIAERRRTSIADYIPDSTPLAEAFFLLKSREWYLTLRGNKISGLITYWSFNSREFKVQLYAGFSRIEELSRDVLAKDGCGISDGKGLKLSEEVLKRTASQFEASRRKLGGNRFVDELQFHHVQSALRKHQPWRKFLSEKVGKAISNQDYEALYDFTNLRNAVMHGRTLFPVYRKFQSFVETVDRIAKYIEFLDSYLGPAKGFGIKRSR